MIQPVTLCDLIDRQSARWNMKSATQVNHLLQH